MINKFEIGDAVHMDREYYEIKDMFLQKTTNKYYYTLKNIDMVSGYRTILVDIINNKATLFRRSWNDNKKCTCGSWTVYGKSCSESLHEPYCDCYNKPYDFDCGF